MGSDETLKEYKSSKNLFEKLSLGFYEPMCFILNDNMYIFDSWADSDTNFCDRYDFRQRKYYNNVFDLPFLSVSTFVTALKITTNADETFALIILKLCNSFNSTMKERFWIFNENEGFKELSSLETLIKLNWKINIHGHINSEKNTDLIRIQ